MSISFIQYSLQYTINGVTYNKQVRPVDEGFELSIEVDDYKRRLKNNGKFTFYNGAGIADYDLLKTIQANDIFQRIYFIVEKKINGGFESLVTLYFSIIDCEFNADRCTCTVTPQAKDEYTCLMDDIETEYNILKEVPVAPAYIIANPINIDLFVCTRTYIITANPTGNSCVEPLTLNWQGGLDFSDAGLTGSAQGLPYDFNSIGGNPTDSYDHHPYYDQKTILAGSCFSNTNFPYSGGWQPVATIYGIYRVISTSIRITGVADPVAGYFYATVETTWGAETVITLNNPVTNAYNPPVGLGWIAFKDIFQGGQQAVIWGREPFYNDQTYIYAHTVSQCNYHEYSLINPYLNNSALRADIYRGRLLNDTIQMYLDKADCGLTLKSEFLQSNINPVTQENNAFYVLNQITDIKTPTSTEAASLMMYKFSDLLDNLQNMFDVRWYISGSDFIIEHISYFKNGYSYTASVLQSVDIRSRVSKLTGKPEIIRSNQYDYDKANIFKSEIISQSQYLDYDFSKLAIKYDLEVIKDDQEKTYQVSIITDVAGVLSAPANFSNDSIVMVAYRGMLINQLNNTMALVVINEPGYRTEDGLNGIDVTNGWLCISNLFNRFYRHNRIRLNGTIENGLPETFQTQTDKIIQKVTLKDCDLSLFFDESLIQTELGTGKVNGASHKVMNETTELLLIL